MRNASSSWRSVSSGWPFTSLARPVSECALAKFGIQGERPLAIPTSEHLRDCVFAPINLIVVKWGRTITRSGDPPRSSSDWVEEFIARWQGREGGQERANYGMFLSELCDALVVAPPDPARRPGDQRLRLRARVKEARSRRHGAIRRIDLYKRDCFVLEAKQSRQKGGDKEVHGQAGPVRRRAAHARRRGSRAGLGRADAQCAQQAEDYVRAAAAEP